MVVGYAVARISGDGKIDLYNLIGKTLEEGKACRIAARIEYPHTYANAVVLELHELDASAVAEEVSGLAHIQFEAGSYKCQHSQGDDGQSPRG